MQHFSLKRVLEFHRQAGHAHCIFDDRSECPVHSNAKRRFLPAAASGPLSRIAARCQAYVATVFGPCRRRDSNSFLRAGISASDTVNYEAVEITYDLAERSPTRRCSPRSGIRYDPNYGSGQFCDSGHSFQTAVVRRRTRITGGPCRNLQDRSSTGCSAHRFYHQSWPPTAVLRCRRLSPGPFI